MLDAGDASGAARVMCVFLRRRGSPSAEATRYEVLPVWCSFLNNWVVPFRCKSGEQRVKTLNLQLPLSHTTMLRKRFASALVGSVIGLFSVSPAIAQNGTRAATSNGTTTSRNYVAGGNTYRPTVTQPTIRFDASHWTRPTPAQGGTYVPKEAQEWSRARVVPPAVTQPRAMISPATSAQMNRTQSRLPLPRNANPGFDIPYPDGASGGMAMLAGPLLPPTQRSK